MKSITEEENRKMTCLSLLTNFYDLAKGYDESNTDVTMSSPIKSEHDRDKRQIAAVTDIIANAINVSVNSTFAYQPLVSSVTASTAYSSPTVSDSNSSLSATLTAGTVSSGVVNVTISLPTLAPFPVTSTQSSSAADATTISSNSFSGGNNSTDASSSLASTVLSSTLNSSLPNVVNSSSPTTITPASAATSVTVTSLSPTTVSQKTQNSVGNSTSSVKTSNLEYDDDDDDVSQLILIQPGATRPSRKMSNRTTRVSKSSTVSITRAPFSRSNSKVDEDEDVSQYFLTLPSGATTKATLSASTTATGSSTSSQPDASTKTATTTQVRGSTSGDGTQRTKEVLEVGGWVTEWKQTVDNALPGFLPDVEFTDKQKMVRNNVIIFEKFFHKK